jgi:hypothetical protein
VFDGAKGSSHGRHGSTQGVAREEDAVRGIGSRESEEGLIVGEGGKK